MRVSNTHTHTHIRRIYKEEGAVCARAPGKKNNNKATVYFLLSRTKKEETPQKSAVGQQQLLRKKTHRAPPQRVHSIDAVIYFHLAAPATHFLYNHLPHPTPPPFLGCFFLKITPYKVNFDFCFCFCLNE